jgi:hypothetical protein
MIRCPLPHKHPSRKIVTSVRALLPVKSSAYASLLLALCMSTRLTWAQDAASGTQEQQIQMLMQQLEAVRAELKQLAQQNQQLMQRQEQLEQQLKNGVIAPGGLASAASPAAPPAVVPLPPASAVATNPIPSAPAPAGGAPSVEAANANAPSSMFGGLKLWGYGEVYYTHPTHSDKDTQFDLARAVFGLGYTFNSRTEFNSEFEVEHAVASASDPGEFEVEQFYVDRQLFDGASLQAGLFLMPFGLLNEHHEPTNFYGVQRNFVETLIIPSTWREGGLNLHGQTPLGLSWSAGLTSGFDLSKWDFAPEFPPYTTALDLENSNTAPLQATHQELALASGEHLSEFVSLSYYGVPGLTIGGALSTGDAVTVPGTAGNQRVTLWEGHARWTPARFDLSALYARGSISNVASANVINPGSPNPIPSQFYGYYLQGAYTLWDQGDYRLSPFARFEYYDMGSEYQGTDGPALPTGSVPLSDKPGNYGFWPVGRDRVWTFGANFHVTPHVVFKADYQHFDLNENFTRYDLGMGVAF